MARALRRVRPHDLLFLGDEHAAEPDAPPWTRHVWRAGWVVVRRATAAPGRVAVGLRGPDRSQRHAAVVDVATVRRVVGPEELSSRPGPRELPAFATLRLLRTDLDDIRLPWGPTGSAGFELATGTATVTTASDLDLLIRAPRPASVWDELVVAATLFEGVSTRVDCQVETRHGAVALAELLRKPAELLLRTPHGPRLAPLAAVLA